MYFEVPVCKRCCFCIPLRYGLLTWGYFKLAISSLITLALILDWSNVMEVSQKYNTSRPLILASIAAIILLLDISMSITFIVGCHLKNVKVLQAFYIYSQIVLGLIIIYDLYFAINRIIDVYELSGNINVWLFRTMDIVLFFADIVVQIYILVLLRSEIIKLNNGAQFKFVNLAANAECTLTMEDDGTNKTEIC